MVTVVVNEESSDLVPVMVMVDEAVDVVLAFAGRVTVTTAVLLLVSAAVAAVAAPDFATVTVSLSLHPLTLMVKEPAAAAAYTV